MIEGSHLATWSCAPSSGNPVGTRGIRPLWPNALCGTSIRPCSRGPRGTGGATAVSPPVGRMAASAFLQWDAAIAHGIGLVRHARCTFNLPSRGRMFTMGGVSTMTPTPGFATNRCASTQPWRRMMQWAPSGLVSPALATRLIDAPRAATARVCACEDIAHASRVTRAQHVSSVSSGTASPAALAAVCATTAFANAANLITASTALSSLRRRALLCSRPAISVRLPHRRDSHIASDASGHASMSTSSRRA